MPGGDVAGEVGVAGQRGLHQREMLGVHIAGDAAVGERQPSIPLGVVVQVFSMCSTHRDPQAEVVAA